MTTVKGVADIEFLTWRNANLSAIVVELKLKQYAKIALPQIIECSYVESLKDYAGEILLCRVDYDAKSKEYSRIIERI